MKQTQQKVSVEGEKFSLALALLNDLQAVFEIVPVAVQKPLILDEIDKHHAVEHQGRIPLTVPLVGNSLDEPQECRVFPFEVVVELFGHTVAIERIAKLVHRARQVDGVFLVQRDHNRGQLLHERVTRVLLSVIGVLAVGGGLAGLA